MPTPIYDPEGVRLADSVTEAARRLDCSRAAIHANARAYADGLRLRDYPSRAKVRAGRLHHPDGPGERPTRPAPTPAACAADGCGRPRWNRTRYCQACYRRLWKKKRQAARGVQ